MKRSSILLALKGFCVGATMLIPGVSGGSMAMILGVYDELISSVSSFLQHKKASFIFLSIFCAGGLLGVLLFATPVQHRFRGSSCCGPGAAGHQRFLRAAAVWPVQPSNRRNTQFQFAIAAAAGCRAGVGHLACYTAIRMCDAALPSADLPADSRLLSGFAGRNFSGSAPWVGVDYLRCLLCSRLCGCSVFIPL